MLQRSSGEEGDREKGSLNSNAEHFFFYCSRIPLQANIFKGLFTPDNLDNKIRALITLSLKSSFG